MKKYEARFKEVEAISLGEILKDVEGLPNAVKDRKGMIEFRWNGLHFSRVGESGSQYRIKGQGLFITSTTLLVKKGSVFLAMDEHFFNVEYKEKEV